jgi:hypothetical protein
VKLLSAQGNQVVAEREPMVLFEQSGLDAGGVQKGKNEGCPTYQAVEHVVAAPPVGSWTVKSMRAVRDSVRLFTDRGVKRRTCADGVCAWAEAMEAVTIRVAMVTKDFILMYSKDIRIEREILDECLGLLSV